MSMAAFSGPLEGRCPFAGHSWRVIMREWHLGEVIELKRLLKMSVAAGIAVSAAVVLAVPGAAQAAGTPGWRFAARRPMTSRSPSPWTA
jgi:hypothetical protein